ncbi:unnamed protein product [Blepharisma stoltei]|uniref:Uncharacterized protein n=1 Tax=Blepharisma stoltei TaxID=1481888 RepID=A0AAU9KGV3_9CILI|nr:unnamed protein product [Blepharisma stoltei]
MIEFIDNIKLQGIKLSFPKPECFLSRHYYSSCIPLAHWKHVFGCWAISSIKFAGSSQSNSNDSTYKHSVVD